MPLSIFFRLVPFVVALLVGCGPRGETRTLDEVVKSARERFYVSSEGKMPADVQMELTAVASRLDKVLDSSATPLEVAEIPKVLDGLITKAGYTSRPALGELLSQWVARSEISKEAASAASDKLLVARTFSALGSELKAVRFALAEREKKT